MYIIIHRNFHAQLLRDDIKHDFVCIFKFIASSVSSGFSLTPLRTRHSRLVYCSNSSTRERSCWITSSVSSTDSLITSMSLFKWSFCNSMFSNLKLMKSRAFSCSFSLWLSTALNAVSSTFICLYWAVYDFISLYINLAYAGACSITSCSSLL